MSADITQTVVTSFLLELVTQLHDFENDVFKLALYDDDAVLDDTITAYTATNEISGTGYTAGGATMTVTAGYPQVSNGITIIDWDDVDWAAATFSARGGLVYNSSSADRAVAVLDFGGLVTSSGGTFRVRLPAATSDLALLRFMKAV